MPKDRAIDGVNQLPFLEGKQARSNRDSVIFFAGSQTARGQVARLEILLRLSAGVGQSRRPRRMTLFNLRSDPKEESDIKDANPWAQSVMDKIVADFMATTELYPHVPEGAPDPYIPPKRR